MLFDADLGKARLGRGGRGLDGVQLLRGQGGLLVNLPRNALRVVEIHLAAAVGRQSRPGIERALHQGQHQRAAEAVPPMIVHRTRQASPSQLIGARRVERDDDVMGRLSPRPQHKHSILTLHQAGFDLTDNLCATV